MPLLFLGWNDRRRFSFKRVHFGLDDLMVRLLQPKFSKGDSTLGSVRTFKPKAGNRLSLAEVIQLGCRFSLRWRINICAFKLFFLLIPAHTGDRNWPWSLYRLRHICVESLSVLFLHIKWYHTRHRDSERRCLLQNNICGLWGIQI